jgi:hypothetical protein
MTWCFLLFVNKKMLYLGYINAIYSLNMKILLALLATTACLHARVFDASEIQAQCARAMAETTDNSYKRAIAQGLHPAYALASSYNEFMLSSDVGMAKKQDMSDTLVAIFQRGHGWGGFSKQKANVHELKAAVDVLRTLSITATLAQRESFKVPPDSSIAAHYSVVDAVLSVGGAYKVFPELGGAGGSLRETLEGLGNQFSLYQKITGLTSNSALETDYNDWFARYRVLSDYVHRYHDISHSAAYPPAAASGGGSGSSASVVPVATAPAAAYPPAAGGAGATAAYASGYSDAGAVVVKASTLPAYKAGAPIDTTVMRPLLSWAGFEDAGLSADEKRTQLIAHNAAETEKNTAARRKQTEIDELSARYNGHLDIAQKLNAALNAFVLNGRQVTAENLGNLHNFQEAIKGIGLDKDVSFLAVQNVWGIPSIVGDANAMYAQIFKNLKSKYGINLTILTLHEGMQQLQKLQRELEALPKVTLIDIDEALAAHAALKTAHDAFGTFDTLLQRLYTQEKTNAKGSVLTIRVGMSDYSICQWIGATIEPATAAAHPAGTVIIQAESLTAARDTMGRSTDISLYRVDGRGLTQLDDNKHFSWEANIKTQLGLS